MKYGTKIHYIFETEDFTNPHHEEVKKLLQHQEIKNIKEAKIFKEYEFYFEEENKSYHGIIDLMLEYQNQIIIIDYKLSDITDENYKKQLQGYKNYIENKTNKPVTTYLYSITQDILKEI